MHYGCIYCYVCEQDSYQQARLGDVSGVRVAEAGGKRAALVRREHLGIDLHSNNSFKMNRDTQKQQEERSSGMSRRIRRGVKQVAKDRQQGGMYIHVPYV